jgi:2-iminoacetate synthase
MTLAEYLEDYASPEVKAAGQQMIERLAREIPSDKIREITHRRLQEIVEGKRDFRF